MKTNLTRTLLLITLLLAFIGAGMAWAHDGWNGRGGHMRGYDGHMGYGGGMGYGGHMGYGGRMMDDDGTWGCGGPMMGPGYGRGYYGDLSDEQRQQLDTAREQFFDQTRELRRNLEDKHYDLQKELAQPNPDRDKIMALQKDISNLRSEFDAKRLEHRLEVNEILPESARGRSFGGGYHRGNRW